MGSRFTVLVTTDGSRPNELRRMLGSVAEVDDALVVLLLQKGSCLPALPAGFKPELSIMQTRDRLSLSEARNTMLDYIQASESRLRLAANSYVLFADDDCWYPNGFFAGLDLGPGINIFDARDPTCDKPFSTFDLRRRSTKRPMASWELMFYAVSIAIAVPFNLIKSVRFHLDFGLGSKVPQGEESILLFELLKRDPRLDIRIHPERTVYHPWKIDRSARNHQALAYFLGWCLRQGFFFVLPYYLYMLAKYSTATVVRPSTLYVSILKALVVDFAKGVINTRRVRGADV